MRKMLSTMALLAGGCGSQIGAEDTGCKVDRTEAVDDLAASPDGFSESVAAMLDRLAGAFTGTFVHPGGEDDLVVTITRAGDPVVERRVDVMADGFTEPAADEDCTDLVRVPVRLALDGAPAFDDTLDAHLFVSPAGKASVSGSLDLDDLEGTAAPTEFDPGDMDAVTVDVHARAVEGGWDGSVTFTGTSRGAGGRGADVPVGATFDEWAAFEVRRAE